MLLLSEKPDCGSAATRAPPPPICVICSSCFWSCLLQLWRRSYAGFHAAVWPMAFSASGDRGGGWQSLSLAAAAAADGQEEDETERFVLGLARRLAERSVGSIGEREGAAVDMSGAAGCGRGPSESVLLVWSGNIARLLGERDCKESVRRR